MKEGSFTGKSAVVNVAEPLTTFTGANTSPSSVSFTEGEENQHAVRLTMK